MWFWIVWSINVALMGFSWWRLHEKCSEGSVGAAVIFFIWLVFGAFWTLIATCACESRTAIAPITLWVPYVIGSLFTFAFAVEDAEVKKAWGSFLEFMGRLW